MRKTGYLGEGGFMMRNSLYGMNVERTVRYDVHELRVDDWKSMIGTPIEEAYGLEPGQKAILGYYNGNPIAAGGEKNYIENVFQMGDGKLGVEGLNLYHQVHSRCAHITLTRAGEDPAISSLAQLLMADEDCSSHLLGKSCVPA